MTALADHLWQSSLFAGFVGLLTLAFLNNAARIRFWLWFAASLKFLVPFAVLALLGERLAHLAPSPLPPAILELAPAAEKWSAPVQALAPAVHETYGLAIALMAIWLAGFSLVLGSRLVRWKKLNLLLKESRPLALEAPVEVRASASLLEPGLVGIIKPVVLLPQGLLPALSGAEREGILAHEFSHLRCRDNLTAALHMVVEAVFWFWPPVWLIGARLIAERERACDESVVAAGHDPETYAGGILKVCRFCIRSPLPCAAGASGADLSQRVRQIMSGRPARALGGGRRLLLAGAALVALALPVLAGMGAGLESQVAAVAPRVAAGITRMVAAAEQIAIAPVQPVEVKRLPRLVREVRIRPALPAILPLPAVPLPAPAMSVPMEPPAAPEPVQTAAAAPAQPAPQPSVRETVLALYPRGDGDPDGVTCRAPQRLPNSRLPGPKVCQANRVWAQLQAEGKILAPDGKTILSVRQAGMRNEASPFACPGARAVGSATNSATGLSGGFCL